MSESIRSLLGKYSDVKGEFVTTVYKDTMFIMSGYRLYRVVLNGTTEPLAYIDTKRIPEYYKLEVMAGYIICITADGRMYKFPIPSDLMISVEENTEVESFNPINFKTYIEFFKIIKDYKLEDIFDQESLEAIRNTLRRQEAVSARGFIASITNMVPVSNTNDSYSEFLVVDNSHIEFYNSYSEVKLLNYNLSLRSYLNEIYDLCSDNDIDGLLEYLSKGDAISKLLSYIIVGFYSEGLVYLDTIKKISKRSNVMYSFLLDLVVVTFPDKISDFIDNKQMAELAVEFVYHNPEIDSNYILSDLLLNRGLCADGNFIFKYTDDIKDAFEALICCEGLSCDFSNLKIVIVSLENSEKYKALTEVLPDRKLKDKWGVYITSKEFSVICTEVYKKVKDFISRNDVKNVPKRLKSSVKEILRAYLENCNIHIEEPEPEESEPAEELKPTEELKLTEKSDITDFPS